MIRYTLLRLLIFFGFLALFLLATVPDLWALIAAALFSMVTSLFLLRRERERMARQIEERVNARRERRAAKVDGERTDEDEEDEESDRSGQ